MRLLLCVLIAGAGWASAGLANEPGGFVADHAGFRMPSIEEAVSVTGMLQPGESRVVGDVETVSYQRDRDGMSYRRTRLVSLLGFIGRSSTLSDFGERADKSFVWGVGMRTSIFPFYALALNFRAASSHKYSVALMEQRMDAGAIGNGSGTFKAMSMTLDHYLTVPLIRLLFGIRPVLIAGAGMYRLTSDPEEVGVLPDDSETTTGLGLNAGGGVSLSGFLLELRYHMAQDGYRVFSYGVGVAIPVF
jgi:hypothetical protein